MTLIKRAKDLVLKQLLGTDVVPRELFELHEYFRINREGINFHYEKNSEGIIATSTNFRYGSIVTFGKNEDELDKNIKDAILTSFEVPSAFEKEAKIYKEGKASSVYALA